VWVQTQRDKQLEQVKGSTPRKDDSTHEFRIGRLKQEKVSIPRGNNVEFNFYQNFILVGFFSYWIGQK